MISHALPLPDTAIKAKRPSFSDAWKHYQRLNEEQKQVIRNRGLDSHHTPAYWLHFL
ncbi:MAG: hypothetical protein HC913_04475 [Microscillaceae bacterium]|nr:hypothetical protein [Microscillaceae bacterium]